MSEGIMQGSRDFFQRAEGWGGTKSNFWLGLVIAVLGAVMVFTMPAGGIQIGGGILLMLTARWAQANPLARVHSDHLEVKLAIAAPKHLVLFSDVVTLKEDLPKKVTLVTREGKEIALPLRSLTLPDADALVNTLRAKITERGEQ